MDIALKYRIVEKIIQSEDELLLGEIGSILGLPESDFWDELPEEIKQSIDKAKTELDNGEGMVHTAFMSGVKDRFLK